VHKEKITKIVIQKERDAYFIPLKNRVVFPGLPIEITIGREDSLVSLKKSQTEDSLIVLVTQINEKTNAPNYNEIYHVGSIAKISYIKKVSDKKYDVTFEPISRVKIIQGISHQLVSIKLLFDDFSNIPEGNDKEYNFYIEELKNEFEKLTGNILNNSYSSLQAIFNDMIETTNLSTKMQQELLAIDSFEDKFARLFLNLSNGKIRSNLINPLAKKVHKRLQAIQQEMFLNEQLKEIKKETGHEDSGGLNKDEFSKRAEDIPLSEEARKKFKSELKRLSAIPSFSPEAGILKRYIETLLDLPWGKKDKEEKNISIIEKELEESHFGMNDVKDQILDFVAARNLAGEKSRSSILCLTGPPGTGKTTLASSIAKSLKRKFIRISLGGSRDEAEIRGHLRTYIGALPGRIIQNIKKAGTSNPVFLLDEIDKLGSDFRGDPASALLEVLDPEINDSFVDRYLDVEFSLRDVFFITTSNAVHNIPAPLRDRMEIIQIAGYTEEEKINIATKYLIPKEYRYAGLKKKNLSINKTALKKIIRYYTKEAGVRNLERNIRKICRKTARKILSGQTEKINLDDKIIFDFLGSPKFRKDNISTITRIGLAHGLAWTASGGEVLKIEARAIPGKGKLMLTGKLGDVMKESCQAALSFTRELSAEINNKIDFSDLDIHIHVPEGAIPKDGPSAGITIAATILSAVFKKKLSSGFAMTGEISLLGDVLRIGGLKEKLLAAKRVGINKVIVPEYNRDDVTDLPEIVTNGMKISYVSTMEQVLNLILPNLKTKLSKG